MGIHLGCGLIVPRMKPDAVASTLADAKNTRKVYVHGPLRVAGPGRKPYDFVVIRELARVRTILDPISNKPLRTGGDFQPAKPLHSNIAANGFELGEIDAHLRALSEAHGDLPVAYLTESSSPEMHSFGVLRKGRWVGFASAGDAGDASFITVAKTGKVTRYPSRPKAGAVDDFARELAAHWKPHKGSIQKFGLVRGIMFADYFGVGTTEPPLLYSIEDGEVDLAEDGARLFKHHGEHEGGANGAAPSAEVRGARLRAPRAPRRPSPARRR